MARARNIKPGLFKNEILGVADPLLTILFQSLWCLADREGRLEDRPLRIKGETFPYRDGINADAMLSELQNMGFILRYKVEGQALIQIINFKKHQTPHNTEKPSEFPAPVTGGLPLDNGEVTEAKRPDSLNLIPDSGLPPTESAPSALDGYTPEFEEAWSSYPQRPGANKKAAFKAWNARLKARVRPEDMIAGARRYAAYVVHEKTEPQFIKQAETFFGPNEHYMSNWTANPRASPGAASQLGKAGQATAANAQRLLEKWRQENGQTG